MYVYMKQTLEGTENYIQRKYEYKLFYQTEKEMKKRDHKLVASNVYIFNLVVLKKNCFKQFMHQEIKQSHTDSCINSNSPRAYFNSQ